MAKIYNYDVMFDDTSIDVSKEVALVWSIANSLRGAYTSDKYKDVIIPMVILRRFECALADTKKAVVDKYKVNPKLPAALLEKASGYPFYNTSEFTLARLLNGDAMRNLTKKSGEKGGGNHYLTKLSYLGHRYAGDVFKEYFSGRISSTRASEMLNSKIDHLPKLESTFYRGVK